MIETEGITRTKTEEIKMLTSGIIHCKVLPDTFLTEDDARENIEAISRMAKGKRVPVIVDIRAAKGASKEARKFFGKKEVAEVQSACAMITGSPLTKLLGNFFIGVNKPLFPTKLFTDEKDALNWLHQIIKHD